MRIARLFEKLGLTRTAAPAPAVSVAVDAAVAFAPPQATFQDRLQEYAEAGRRGEISMGDDEYKYAIKPAARAGDLDFLRTAHEQRPDLFEKKDGWLLKEALTNAIIGKHPGTVAFLLNEAHVNPVHAIRDSYGHDESHKLPQYDALFVAATGFIPTDFRREPGTVWRVDTPADARAEQVFDIVLDAYKGKYQGDNAALKHALTRTFSMFDKSVFWGPDYYVQSTKSSYASIDSAARPNLREKLHDTLRTIALASPQAGVTPLASTPL